MLLVPLRLGDEKERKKETTGQKCNALPYSMGRPQQTQKTIVVRR